MPILKGKTALITGASKGIGAAIAKRLAAEGAHVICAARTIESQFAGHSVGINTVVKAINENLEGTACAIQCELSSREGREKLFRECSEQFGGVDILINNGAATSHITAGTFDTIKNDNFRIQFEINFFAVFELVQLFAPHMLANGWGRIINISSCEAEGPKPPPFHSDLIYGSTKAAVNRLTLGLASDFKGTGVTVNALSPVFSVRTEHIESLLERFPAAQFQEGWQEEPIEAIAESALSLCSPESETTGRILYSLNYLQELQRPLMSLDGTHRLNDSSLEVK